jgi:hypothetical protein
MYDGYRDIEIVQERDGSVHVEWDADDKAKYKQIWADVVQYYAVEKHKMQAAAFGYSVEESVNTTTNQVFLTIHC